MIFAIFTIFAQHSAWVRIRTKLSTLLTKGHHIPFARKVKSLGIHLPTHRIVANHPCELYTTTYIYHIIPPGYKFILRHWKYSPFLLAHQPSQVQ